MLAPEILAIPPQLVGGVARLPDLMVAFATLMGTERPEAERIAALVPDDLKQAPCFLDRLTATWRYIYGHPLESTSNAEIVLGTHMYHDVNRLFAVISCADKRLPLKALRDYVAALAHRAKHADALTEFAPIIRLNSDAAISIQYEVPGAGESTIDWLIQRPGDTDLFLEVKNRVRDLVEGLSQTADTQHPENRWTEPAHDHDLLFRNVEQKFQRRDPSQVLHAVWIRTDVKQEEGELRAAFMKLDSERVHAAILGDWQDDAYVLACNEEAKQHIVRMLRLTESRRFVFRRGELPI